MAYIIELEEDFAGEGEHSDIPTTTIRSKADVEDNVSHQTTLSTNDIVINKLTQVRVCSKRSALQNLNSRSFILDFVIPACRKDEQEEEKGQGQDYAND